jgi:NAD(P)-dependent dehydrogenase (short-subunit alcohol dehydrogenase family)
MLTELFSLEGRVALVTGGSRGLGKMIAAAFIEQGAKVYIASRRADALQVAAEELGQGTGRCEAIAIDASTVEGARALAAELAHREPRLDILVNNAGAAWLAPFDDFSESGWDKVMDINVKTPFFLTQALAPMLRAAGSAARPAKVINIASVDGLTVNPQETYSYAASKAAVIHLSRRMATRLVREHIAVNVIAPGHFASDMNVRAREGAPELIQRIPAGRIGNAADIAGAAVYLASRAGDYAIGSTLVVDGGWAHSQ